MQTACEISKARQPAPKGICATELSPGLKASGFSMRFERDEEIFGESESADFFYRVSSGVVRTFRVLDDGRRQISGFHFAGDVFGLEAGDVHGATAEAVTECVVVLVKRVSIGRMAAQDPAAACGMWALTSRQMAAMQAHLVLLGRKTALERVASFLLQLAERDSDDTVAIPMSRLDIADYLGLTIETVSRAFSQLEREGTIDLPNCRHMALRDHSRLERLAA